MNIFNKIFKTSPLLTSGHNGEKGHKHNYEITPEYSPKQAKIHKKKMNEFRGSLEYKYPIRDHVGEGKQFIHSNQYTNMITTKMENFWEMATQGTELFPYDRTPYKPPPPLPQPEIPISEYFKENTKELKIDPKKYKKIKIKNINKFNYNQ